MGRESTPYQYLTSRGFVEYCLAYLVILYPLLFVVTNRNMGSLSIGYIVLYSIYHLRFATIGALKHLLWISILVYGISFYHGFLQGYTVQAMGKEFYYYAKPFAFFLFGIQSVRVFHESRYFKFLLLILFLGTILFYIFPGEMIDASHQKSQIGNGWGHFISFSYFLRSGSFLLSPLETSFFSAFLGIFFYHNRNQLRLGRQYFLLSSVCLFMSMTRSVILAYSISILFLHLSARFSGSAKWMKWALPAAAGLLVVALGWYARESILKNDGSIMLHFSNLNSTLSYLIQNPWGYGMSSSGYVSVLEQRDAMYSEGSFFTYLIECGIQALLLFGLLGYYCFKKGLLPLTLFFFYGMVSLVLPIGFSTPFCFLFFGCLGAISHLNANRYSDHKLQ